MQAVATIFADGFATAASKCYKGCQADSASMAKVIGEILATATSKTMDDQCTGTPTQPPVELCLMIMFCYLDRLLTSAGSSA